MTLREELIAIIQSLSDDDLAIVAPAIRSVMGENPRLSMQEALRRADDFRQQVWKPSGEQVDVVQMLNDLREERLDDIFNGLR